MPDLLVTAEFWFGAAMLGAYQFAKFSELSSLDPELAARNAAIPNLRAIDFAGRLTYCAALAAFLAATFIAYFVLCNVSPTILIGWAHVSGATPGDELEKFAGSVNYPLYIAAAFIGLTQPGIPWLASVGNVQRNFFHAWMGVPRRVMSASSSFYNQILTRSPARNQMAREVQALIGDEWVSRLDAYADSDFYRAQLARLKLDDEAEVKELLRGSRRELKNLIRQLVDIATLATVREGGAASIRRLADDLRVSLPWTPGWSQAFFSGGVLFLIGMTVLWNLIPMLDGAAQALSAGSTFDFWPSDLKFSGQYLVSQALPIFLATGLTLGIWLGVFQRQEGRSGTTPGPIAEITAHFHRYAGLLAAIVIGVVLFDVLQAFFDYGFYRNGQRTGFWAFIQANLPFYLLHSFISLVVSFWVLLYMDENDEHVRCGTRNVLLLLIPGVAAASFFYAAARVQYQFGPFGPNGLDLAVLLAAINMAAAGLAFASATLCKRQTRAPGASANASAPIQAPNPAIVPVGG
jgi:hypothetical protein